MLTYNMDVTRKASGNAPPPAKQSWHSPITAPRRECFTPSSIFHRARTDKESYILFYTLRGAGLIEQGKAMWCSAPGRRAAAELPHPQSYCTAPGQSCWHHYWVHLDGAGVAAMEPLLLPAKTDPGAAYRGQDGEYF